MKNFLFMELMGENMMSKKEIVTLMFLGLSKLRVIKKT